MELVRALLVFLEPLIRVFLRVLDFNLIGVLHLLVIIAVAIVISITFSFIVKVVALPIGFLLILKLSEHALLFLVVHHIIQITQLGVLYISITICAVLVLDTPASRSLPTVVRV